MNREELIKHYYNIGFSLIPIKNNTKTPVIPWRNYQDGKLPPEFFKDYQDCNLAVITGSISGIDVLDLDEYKKAFPSSKIILDTPLIASTPRGGRHGYFKHKIGNRSVVNKELAIDFKSEGGYVLVAPSIIDDKKYTFNILPTKELIASLPELNKEILDSIIGVNKEAGQLSKRFDILSAFGTSTGGRNDVLKRAVLSILNKYEEKDWDTKALEEIRVINSTFKPPVGERELMYLFNYEKRYCKNNPKLSLIEDTSFKQTTIEEDNEAVIAQITEGKSMGYSTGFYRLDELLGGLTPGDTYLFFADTNVGKSALTASILLNAATKHNIKSLYFDLENPFIKTVSRLVLLNEDGFTKEEWQEKIETGQGYELAPLIRKLNDIPIKTWDLVKIQKRFSEITYEAVEKCMLEGVKEGMKIFVIDHLHYFEPSEQDFSKVGNIAKKLNDFAGIHNVVILMVAHTKKGLKRVEKDKVVVRRPIIDDISGSSFITKHTKNIIGIRRDDSSDDLEERKKVTLYVDKTKNGETGIIDLTFDPHTLHFLEDGVPVNTTKITKIIIEKQEEIDLKKKEAIEEQKQITCKECGTHMFYKRGIPEVPFLCINQHRITPPSPELGN